MWAFWINLPCWASVCGLWPHVSYNYVLMFHVFQCFLGPNSGTPFETSKVRFTWVELSSCLGGSGATLDGESREATISEMSWRQNGKKGETSSAHCKTWELRDTRGREHNKSKWGPVDCPDQNEDQLTVQIKMRSSWLSRWKWGPVDCPDEMAPLCYPALGCHPARHVLAS